MADRKLLTTALYLMWAFAYLIVAAALIAGLVEVLGRWALS